MLHDRSERRAPRIFALVAVLAAAAMAACTDGTASAGSRSHDTAAASATHAAADAGTPIPAPSQRKPGTPPAREAVPGLGPHTMKKVPARSHQVVVSTTKTKKGTRAHTTLYRLSADGSWAAVGDWSGHNGRNGWEKKRSVGDATSPIGVFGLTDGGGYLKNPGTALTYDRDPNYRGAAGATYGAKFDKVFNYVIAINYNRVPGSKPTDGRHPDGAARGGKIWLHVDHHGPTRGCITLPQSGVKFLLTHLKPKADPVLVSGPHPTISR